MPTRRLLRIGLSLVLIGMIWLRLPSGSWGAGKVALTAILILVVGMEFAATARQGRRPKDEVPKRPLGL